MPELEPVTLRPIGVVHSPFKEKAEAPRQAVAAEGVEATIELFPGHHYEDGLEDLDGWDRIWVVFHFHLVTGWRPKVLPPRSDKRRGVFATRSPHRPNPIGLSVVRLVAVEGLTLRVRDIDIVDGTPVLDLKPYVPYADAHPASRTGWLRPLSATAEAPTAADPEPGFRVAWSALAAEQLAFLRDAHGIDLEAPVARHLALGPQPHAYRRIRVERDGSRLAWKDWRIHFRVDGRTITVVAIATGYRPAQLAANPCPEPLVPHRAFVERFGRAGA